jgi:uncharacterized protein
MDDTTEKNTICELTRIQRRVLGTLVEKGLTTPDQYPLTLKSTTTGCNQKSNRAPIAEFSEGDVADTLEDLRDLGLIAEVFTDGGRSARYRHYARRKFDFTETQLGIITELWLRGKQQPGELRTRASRMARIASKDELKRDLQALQDMGFVQSSGPLDRRGVEVDHTFYLAGENMTLAGGRTEQAKSPSKPVAVSASGSTPDELAARAAENVTQQLVGQVAKLQLAIDSIDKRLAHLESELL